MDNPSKCEYRQKTETVNKFPNNGKNVKKIVSMVHFSGQQLLIRSLLLFGKPIDCSTVTNVDAKEMVRFPAFHQNCRRSKLAIYGYQWCPLLFFGGGGGFSPWFQIDFGNVPSATTTTESLISSGSSDATSKTSFPLHNTETRQHQGNLDVTSDVVLSCCCCCCCCCCPSAGADEVPSMLLLEQLGYPPSREKKKRQVQSVPPWAVFQGIFKRENSP